MNRCKFTKLIITSMIVLLLTACSLKSKIEYERDFDILTNPLEYINDTYGRNAGGNRLYAGILY